MSKAQLKLVTATPAPIETPLCARPWDRGYVAVYRPGEVNHCPGCGRSHWYVGRFSAECGFCGTALPFVGGAL